MLNSLFDSTFSFDVRFGDQFNVWFDVQFNAQFSAQFNVYKFLIHKNNSFLVLFPLKIDKNIILFR